MSDFNPLIYFPGYDADEVLERVRERWAIDEGWPLPKYDWVECRCCGASGDDLQIRQFSFHRRKNSTHEFRADVFFKCCVCSVVFTFGVPISEQMYQAKKKAGIDDNRHVDWKRAAEMMEGDE